MGQWGAQRKAARLLGRCGGGQGPARPWQAGKRMWVQTLPVPDSPAAHSAEQQQGVHECRLAAQLCGPAQLLLLLLLLWRQRQRLASWLLALLHAPLHVAAQRLLELALQRAGRAPAVRLELHICAFKRPRQHLHHDLQVPPARAREAFAQLLPARVVGGKDVPHGQWVWQRVHGQRARGLHGKKR